MRTSEILGRNKYLVCGVGLGSVWPPLKISCLCIGCCVLMFVSIWKKLLFNMVNVTPTPTQYTYINLYTHLVCGVGVGSVWPPLKISCLCIGCCDLMFVSIWKKLLLNMVNVTPTPTSNTHFKHLSITFWKAPGCFWAHAVCIENCL